MMDLKKEVIFKHGKYKEVELVKNKKKYKNYKVNLLMHLMLMLKVLN